MAPSVATRKRRPPAAATNRPSLRGPARSKTPDRCCHGCQLTVAESTANTYAQSVIIGRMYQPPTASPEEGGLRGLDGYLQRALKTVQLPVWSHVPNKECRKNVRGMIFGRSPACGGVRMARP